jgi:hypothetical protein
MKSRVINRVTLHSGGATSPTFELYQLARGRCRLWAYWFDQDGQQSETIAAFHERDWAKAQLKAKEPLKAALASKPEQEMKTKLQLTITVTFSKRLAPREKAEAKRQLADAANHLADEGLLTGDGPELAYWRSDVVELKPIQSNEVGRQRTRR